MLVRGMVQHHFNDDANAALVGRIEKSLEVVEGSVGGIDGTVIGDVVSVIAQGRREKRHEPDGIDPEVLQVVEPLRQSAEIAVSVARAVVKSPDVDLINDRVLVPKPCLQSQSSFLD